MKKYFLFIIALILLVTTNYGQSDKKEYQIRTISFYNLENLFDTINDPKKNDEASPMMELKENKTVVYQKKLKNMAKVISEIGLDIAKTSPAIIGVSEIENRDVLEDLINTEALKKYSYNIIHYDSPDYRGIDVALLYQEEYFKPIHHDSFELKLWSEKGKRYYTRDQLLVSGYLDDEMVHIIVNHWPSRRGGEKKSRPSREKAAALNMEIINKIRESEPNAKIITMGDFNDDPNNSSIKKVLKAKGKKKDLKEGDIYNPMEDMFRRGFNTLGYRDNINLFDQILMTSPLVTSTKDYTSYKLYKANIFNPKYLISSTGRYKGYPFRSFSYSTFTDGYSDHFPVYIYLIKEKK